MVFCIGFCVGGGSFGDGEKNRVVWLYGGVLMLMVDKIEMEEEEDNGEVL